MKRPLEVCSFLVVTVLVHPAFGQANGAGAAPTMPPTGVGAASPAPPPPTPAPPPPATDQHVPAESAGAPPTTLLSLDPASPELNSIPGITPAFGSLPTHASDWRFDFHGLLFVPLRVGFNTRLDPQPGQETTVFHAPPVIPENFMGFGYTSVAPDPWAQVNFSYGNKNVTATVIIAARDITEGASYFNPPDQLGINDAFVTFRIANEENYKLKADVGAFANRYGNMGEYDSGRYGTPMIARVGGVGATITGSYATEPMVLVGELGFMGQLNKAPLNVAPAGWNGFVDTNAGTSFVPHLHLGASYLGLVQGGLHFLRALSQDDRATQTNQPDGYIDVFAADARVTARRYGHFYAALARTQAHHARAVSGVLEIMNAPGGLGLMNEYLGGQSGGTGSLTTVAAQYDLSIGNLLRYPSSFEGNGPDLFASVFGVMTAITSNDPTQDGKKKLKYGAELTYSPLPWLAFGGRYDRVIQDIDTATSTTSIVSPRVIFRSGYNAHDEVLLQYSHWFNGSAVFVDTGSPPVPDPTTRPDEDVLALMVSMWW